jgi:ABC-type transport system substrate-binding protein
MLALSTAAPRVPYGGTAVALVYGAPLSLDPRAISTAADASLSSLVYESLYALDEHGALVPVLARALPELRGTTLVVPLRTDVVFHDNKTLTASLVARHFLSLAEERSNSSFIVVPVRGALSRLAGDKNARVYITAREEDATVSFELIEAYDGFARLLASPRAAIPGAALASRDELFGLRAVGTGPFSVLEPKRSNEHLSLWPFRGHLSGRPFLETLQIKAAVSRFGTISLLKRADAAVVFGVPDVRAAKHHQIVSWDKRRLPLELTVLAIGDGIGELATEDGRRAIDLALDRPTLAKRFLGNGAEPVSNLFGEMEQAREGGLRERPGMRATLLVSQADSEAKRVAERVQLDLLRAGITVIIEKVPFSVIENRRRDRRYDLMVDTVYADGQPGGVSFDRLHALLSLAAMRGAPNVLSEAELTSFLRRSEEGRRLELPALEKEIRLRAGIVPIAARAPVIGVQKTLLGWKLTPLGTIELADAYFSAEQANE